MREKKKNRKKEKKRKGGCVEEGGGTKYERGKEMQRGAKYVLFLLLPL